MPAQRRAQPREGTLAPGKGEIQIPEQLYNR